MIPKSGNRFSDKIMLKREGALDPGGDWVYGTFALAGDAGAIPGPLVTA
jgi:hypothetical protein